MASLEPALENLLFRYLKIARGERMIFIHDSDFRTVSPALESVASKRDIQFDDLEIEYDGIRPLDSAAADFVVGTVHRVVLFGTVHNIWHTPERRKAKHELGKRLAAFVCSPEDIGSEGSLAEAVAVGAAARQMSQFFSSGMEVTVTTPGGSDFSAVIGKAFCEHGNYDVPGTGGDFPAGEVGFGPKLGSVNGHIVYDIKVQHIGVLNEALRLHVENDRVCEVSGPAANRFREICTQRGDILNYISEISIGLNPLAGVSAAPAYIPEEKTFGTLHCGHGGNASYGERVGAHIDGVMAKPTLVVGGRKLMQDGGIPAGLIEESSRKWLAQKL
jgi:leucyl aminopeptidase (aminopeptidase T)